MKLYIIANRLPVKANRKDDGSFTFTRSEGGLATGLNSLQTSDEKHWIGWPGVCVHTEAEQACITQALHPLLFHPVFLSDEQYANYYEGYSNSTIWPLCHYFYSYTQYKNCFWKSYQEVNRLFCDEICKIVDEEDYVWIQDYQLMLLPSLLRQRMPKLHISYFHHIPFPSYELFRILPERADLLRGLLGADFIAFHTHDYMRHFISAAERVLNIDFKLDETLLRNRIVRVDALPMGINYDFYHHSCQQPEVQKNIHKYRQLFGSNKLVLSVDRLDYSKGILHRLRGFSSFLDHHPEYHGKITLAMIIVPSRNNVDCYAELKTRIDEEIGSINGRHSTIDWTPVCYLYHAFSIEELTAMYHVADIAMVTPLRDGMNLVAKEYVATKQNNPGVLILSEMAGAAVELGDALQINPNDIDEVEHALCQALEMPYEEQQTRINHMQAILSRQTVKKWATDFINEWKQTCERNRLLDRKQLTPANQTPIIQAYAQARRRLILLDYDGTLAPLQDRPEDARPTPELTGLLQQLGENPANHVVINSGRGHLILEKWLGHLPVSFAAEHGTFYKENGAWHQNLCNMEWSAGLLSLLNMFVAKTPRSHLEVKKTALAWHYRQCDNWLGTLRAQQLMNTLMPICMKQKLQIMEGNKVVEIKSPEFTKGSEVNRLLQKEKYDFILAIGDDTTDDDMFQALPKNAVTVKVGAMSDWAAYNLPEQAEVIPFLQSLCREDAGKQSAAKRLHPLLAFLRKYIRNKS